MSEVFGPVNSTFSRFCIHRAESPIVAASGCPSTSFSPAPSAAVSRFRASKILRLGLNQPLYREFHAPSLRCWLLPLVSERNKASPQSLRAINEGISQRLLPWHKANRIPPFPIRCRAPLLLRTLRIAPRRRARLETEVLVVPRPGQVRTGTRGHDAGNGLESLNESLEQSGCVVAFGIA